MEHVIYQELWSLGLLAGAVLSEGLPLWYGSPLDNRGGARRMEQKRQSIMDSTVLLKEE